MVHDRCMASILETGASWENEFLLHSVFIVNTK